MPEPSCNARANPSLPVRVYEHRLTWWAQIDGTLCAGGAFKVGDGRERAIRKALTEYARTEARRRAEEARAAASEVEFRDDLPHGV